MHKQRHVHLEIYPNPSLSLGVFIVASHLLAGCICVYLIAWQFWCVLLLPVVLISLLWNLRKQRADAAHRITRMICYEQGKWRWQYAGGSSGQGITAPSSLRLPWLVILNLRNANNGKIERLVLPRDSMGDDPHRRLRVLLAMPVAAA